MFNQLRKTIFKGMQKGEKVFSTLLISLAISSTGVTQVFATQQPKLVSGTIALLKAASGWLLLIIPVGAGLFVAYHAIQKAMTDDEAVIAQKNKLIKNTVIGAIIAECANGLITVILGFYS